MKRSKEITIAAYYFLLYCIVGIFVKIFKIKKNYWAISERGYDAGDNGFALFKYIKENHEEINVRYIITNKSKDYDKVSKYGKTIKYKSLEHIISNLTSPVLISTHIYGYAVNQMAFKLYIILFGNRGKMISVKHGITKDYIPALEQKNTKLDMIIAGAKKEYEYMKITYGYNKKQLVFTGFPRFDKLTNQSDQKTILIMPTWRHDIKNKEEFIKSDFYKHYQSLLNDKSLHHFLDETGGRIVFYPHYEFQKYSHLFTSNNKNISVHKSNKNDVQKLLKTSALLITDYSSVFYDFAYMKKPVIYYQFDYDNYRKNNYKEGYFNYDKDGFGPVVNKQNILIQSIVESNKAKYKIDKKNEKKINNFFGKIDKNNSERVLNAIKDLLQ